MKGSLFIASICILNPFLWGLKNDPWINPPYELGSNVEYAFSYFPSVDTAINPQKYSSYVNDLSVELFGSVTPVLFLELEMEFNNSKELSFDFKSIAPSLKYQWMNDLTGDQVALVLGTYFRYVPYHRLTDVATPYSGEYNFDILCSLGKEFNQYKNMVGSFYALFDVGIATVGKPWILADLEAEISLCKKRYIGMGAEGFFGFGNKKVVNIDLFEGYGDISHSNLDIKAFFKYKFSVWGEILLTYKRRVVAIRYPENLDYGSLKYQLNFSF